MKEEGFRIATMEEGAIGQLYRLCFWWMLLPYVLTSVFSLGLVSGGILWPKWMTRRLFSGDVSGNAAADEYMKKLLEIEKEVREKRNEDGETDSVEYRIVSVEKKSYP